MKSPIYKKGLSFNKEQIGFIKKAKKQVEDFEKKQERVYNNLVESLGLELNSEEEGKLFDYIYNDFGTISVEKE